MSGRQDLAERLRSLSAHLSQLPGISRPSETEGDTRLERMVSDQELLSFVAPLYADGHYAQAVEEACKFLDNLVKRRSGRSDLTGPKLMQKVFSLNQPILALNSGTTQSERDEQVGYMQLFAGVMTGVRNPRAHEHEWTDTKGMALCLLAFVNHLVGRVRSATKV